MRDHEVNCFANAIGCDRIQIKPFDLVGSRPGRETIDSFDAVLIGGSGDYSVVDCGDWFVDACRLFRLLFEMGKPTFASCWGFQAFAKALGGKVVTDLSRAEVGTFELQLTDDAISDPVFSPLGKTFFGQLGHQDIVDELPDQATLLCSTVKVTNQAFTFSNKPIYATQFHPELKMDDLVKRLIAYPEYVKKITGMEMAEFIATCQPADATLELLQRFTTRFVNT